MSKRAIPVAIALGLLTFLVGLLTFLGLLLNLPQLSSLLLRWAGFLAAVALLLGILNLFAVHVGRLFKGNIYSAVLALSMVMVFALAIAERFDLVDGGVNLVFNLVQAPLEMALASLLAFFLLFSGFQLLRRQRTFSAVLFLLTVVLVLLGTVLANNRFIPAGIGELFAQIRQTIDSVFVVAGMRGILIGVALGTITLSIRLLVGAERPYNK
ncbi:MAG: hypothetical protein KC413_11010 [Anaerolineales bacterium]|nr:hypothetical protein [Anaerolineales bacterium]MCA9976274.1 hypothetical protein [Anaerolineales bacterium]MCB8966302.1 hypothetical protein [Ardenticatenaceae bacterium]